MALLSAAVLPLALQGLAITGGTVHSQVPGEAPRVATVLVQDGVVVAVGADLELPAGTEVLDATGLHVVPGLVDALVHFDPAHDALYTAAGVTLVRDLGSDPTVALAQRAPSARDVVPGPHVLAPGPMLAGVGAEGSGARVVADAEAAGAAIGELADLSVDYVVAHDSLANAAWAGVVEAAHDAGLDVWGPRPGSMPIEEALAGGQDGFFYLDSLLPPDSAITWEIVFPIAFKARAEALAAARAPLVPALGAIAYRLDEHSDEDPILELLAPQLRFLWEEELAARRMALAESEDLRELGERIVGKQAEVLGMLHEAGVPLLPGSGAPSPWIAPGAGLVEELVRWQAAGLPASAALRAATVDAVRDLGLPTTGPGARGVVAPGAVADLVVVEGDPSEDVAALRAPRSVVVRGQALRSEDLSEMVEALRAELMAIRVEESLPLTIEPPEVPPGLPLLAGQVETSVHNVRLAGERFAVVFCEDGRIAYCGRIVEAGPDGGAPVEINVVQWTREGQLDELRVELDVDGEPMVCLGRWRDELDSFQVVRQQGEEVLSSQGTVPGEHPRALAMSTITTALVLGHMGSEHLDAAARIPVLTLGPGLVPEVIPWRVGWESDRTHKVETPGGLMIVEFDEQGGIEASLRVAGEVQLLGMPVFTETFGGAGWPIPPEKLAEARVAEARRAAEAEAAGADGEAGEAGTDGEGDPPAEDPPDPPVEDPVEEPAATGGSDPPR